MPQKGHNQCCPSTHWDGTQSQDSRTSSKFLLDTNDSSLRVPTLADIEVTPCHCFPGEMCYDTCSIHKQFQEVTPRQCSKRLQTAANGYSAQGVSTEKFPGVKVLVGRNGLPIIVNPSFAFPSPSKCNHHLDNFPERDPSMLCLGGQDSFPIPPPPTPMSSSLPKSQLPILSLLSARECSSAPAICKGETDCDSSFLPSPSSRSSSVSRDSRTSLSSTRTGESRKSVLPETIDNVTITKKENHYHDCNNTRQAEFNELLVKMNPPPSSSTPKTCSSASFPQSYASSVSDFPVSISPVQTPSNCSRPSPFPSPRVAASSSSSSSAATAVVAVVDANTPSRNASQESMNDNSNTRSATHAPSEEVVVHTPPLLPLETAAGSKAAISVQVAPTCHTASPSSPLGFPFSPTFSSFRSSRSFSGRTVPGNTPANTVHVASAPPPTPTASSSPAATSCPSFPKRVAVHSSPPRATTTRGQPSIPPILEHAPLTCHSAPTTPANTSSSSSSSATAASKTKHSSSTSSATATAASKQPSSSASFPPNKTPVISSHRCQVLNLTDAIRQLNGGLFEDESPTEVFQDYYDWIEGRG